MPGWAFDALVVLQEHAVLDYGDIGGLGELAIFPPGMVEDHLVGFPFAGREAGVDLRRILAVDRAALAVGVGRIFVAIQNLKLKLAHQEDSAIAAALTVP